MIFFLNFQFFLYDASKLFSIAMKARNMHIFKWKVRLSCYHLCPAAGASSTALNTARLMIKQQELAGMGLFGNMGYW